MTIIYDIIFILFAILYLPYTVICGKWHANFKMRFGMLPESLVKTCEHKPCIWIHAVSVGEVMAVKGLIEQVSKNYPQYHFVCSTVTKTGNALAQEQLSRCCTVIYAPLDFSFIVRKFIAILKPKLYVSAETEIWPNLYTALHKQGIPIIQVNGRISDNSYRGYRWARFLTKRVLACVDLFYMQSDTDADRIKELGAPENRVFVAGNLKFDSTNEQMSLRKEDIGFRNDESLLIAGSTHPGEEIILINIYKRLVKEFLSLRLVIAPRHIERVEEVVDLINKSGFYALRYSEIDKNTDDMKAIIVVDTIGDLFKLYSLSKIVFIGKSLTVGGGQNMIEPASFGKPTIVGPKTQNFKDAVNLFLQSDALVQVNNEQELLDVTQELLTNSELSQKIGQAAQATVKKYQGATAKTINAIAGLLDR